MVTKTCEPPTIGCRFELRPNQSLSARGRQLFLVLMVTLSLAIAGWFLSLGAWMVFPFAGLEMLALGSALWWVGRAAERRENLDLVDGELRVSRSSAGVARSWSFQLHWLRVTLEKSAHRNHPRRLLLGSHGRFVEVGRMLTDDEREQLFTALKQVIADSRAVA